MHLWPVITVITTAASFWAFLWDSPNMFLKRQVTKNQVKTLVKKCATTGPRLKRPCQVKEAIV